jgi:hypothetical protein
MAPAAAATRFAGMRAPRTQEGGHAARFTVEGVVVASGERKGRPFVHVHAVPAKIYGDGLDYVAHGPFAVCMPTRKIDGGAGQSSSKVGTGTMVAKARVVEMITPYVGSLSNTPLKYSFFPDVLEKCALPEVGDTVRVPCSEGCYPKDNGECDGSYGTRVYLNASRFEVLSSPKDRFRAVCEAFEAPGAVATSLLSLSLSCGLLAGERDDAGQKESVRAALRKSALVAGSKFRKTAEAIEVVDRSLGTREHLDRWIADCDAVGQVSSGLCPVATVADAYTNCFKNFVDGGICAALVHTGATPEEPYPDACRRMNDVFAADDVKSAFVCARVADCSLSKTCAIMQLSLEVSAVSDARALRALSETGVADPQEHVLLPKRCGVDNAPFLLGVKVSGVPAHLCSNYPDRLRVVGGELGASLDWAGLVSAPAMASDFVQNVVECEFASSFVVDLPKTLARLLPALTVDEVVEFFNGRKIVVHDDLSEPSTELVGTAQTGSLPVSTNTFAKRLVAPLGEVGVNIDTYDKIATDAGKTLRFAAVYEGAVSAAWKSGGEFPEPGDGTTKKTLEEAAKRAGFATVEEFAGKHCVIYAYGA